MISFRSKTMSKKEQREKHVCVPEYVEPVKMLSHRELRRNYMRCRRDKNRKQKFVPRITTRKE